jgi:ankyrin repeat protein
VKNGADVNKNDSNGQYPLHVAISRQHDEICEFLLNNGALINVIDKQGNTPLALAINNDYLFMIDILLNLGADTNISDNNGIVNSLKKFTPLFLKFF